MAILDLHANISDQMIAQASLLEAYRTYPHIDMGATGARAADHLDLLLRHGLARYPVNAVRRPDFLLPPVSGCTLVGPAHSVYARLGQLVNGEVSGLSLACGFPASDVAEVIPAKNHRRKKQYSLPQRFPGNVLGYIDDSRPGAGYCRCCVLAISES